MSIMKKKILFIKIYLHTHNFYPLKVIQIIDSLNVGGAEVIAVNIANGLSKEGVESHICTTRKEGLLKSNIDKFKMSFLLTVDTKCLIKNWVITPQSR